MAKKKKKQKYKKKKVAKPQALKPLLSSAQGTNTAKPQKKQSKKKGKGKKEKKQHSPKFAPKFAQKLIQKLTQKSAEKQAQSAKEPAKPAQKSAEKQAQPAKKPTQQPAKSAQPAQPAKPAQQHPFIISLKEFFKAKLAKDLRKPIIAIFSFFAIFVLFFISSTITTYQLADKTMPGTRLGEIDLGLLTVDELQKKLIEKGEPFLQSKIAVTVENSVIEFSPQELGINLNTRATIDSVEFIKYGKTNLIDIIAGLIKPGQVKYEVAIDLEKAARTIENGFNFAEIKSANAYLAFEEKNLVIIPERHGKTINLRSLYLDLKENANSLSLSPIQVDLLDDTPLVTQESLEAGMDRIKELLNNQTKLAYEHLNYTVKLIDHIDWVKFEYDDTFKIGDGFSFPIELKDGEAGSLKSPLSVERKLKIAVQKEPFAAWADEKIIPNIGTEPQDVEIYRDENGKIAFEGRGENGKKIIMPVLTAALEEAVNNEIKSIPIPVREQYANVKTTPEFEELGIKNLIGTGASAFAGSPPNRVHNINVGVARYNGVLIAPGETFSFNTRLGSVDASTGYKPELVIKPEGTIPEYGGGLCQVSSTMYRAALFTGLPITQRAPHSYAVSYYAQMLGYGMDATIYPGVHDLKFINDTPGHILIQSYTDGVKAFYKFYGTDDGRRVKMEGPYNYGYHSPGPTIIVESPGMAPGARKQVEKAHTGFTSTWYRYITKDGETVKEVINSAYRAIPAKILVGPSAAPAE